jgi:2-hydroxychromene-2-carboxylate isomerase
VESVHVVYGDFGCPLSYLASTWCDELTKRGALEVEWRAVQHDPGIPRRGRKIDEVVDLDLSQHVDEAIERFAVCGRRKVALPPILPNTSLAIGVLAGEHGPSARRLRRSIFAALWRDGLDLGRWEQLDRIRTTPLRADFTRAARWRRSWDGYNRPELPAIVLPTGAVLQQHDALAYLDSQLSRTRALTPN